jgi:hypothetical protein
MKPRLVFAALLFGLVASAAPPAPKEFFGFSPGDDYKLASTSEILGYFQKLEASSDRIRLLEFGKSSEGRPMIVAFISSPENLKQLERWKQMNRSLALGLATPDEARQYSQQGKSIIWIDSGLHATEVAPAQHAPHLAYQMVNGETEEIRRIRENVILMQVPVINPDGLEMVVQWYRKNVGTPFEIAPLPELYQKYAGHDNNRDYFMYNLAETRAVGRMLFSEWFPQVVYNQHQQGPLGARFSIPPYAEPLNPNIAPAVMQGISLIGMAMHERLAAEGKGGVQSYLGYDAWWNGGLRSAPAFHNMHGILTEAALFAYATPRDFKPSELPDRLATGVPAKEPSMFQPIPWPGGKWGVRESIDYMLTADFALLNLASERREQFLRKSWEMARAQIEAGQKGKPFAYVIAPEQHDESSARELLRRLMLGGIEVQRAQQPFTAAGKSYPAGAYVLPAGQPFRGYLLDLMEPQKYPEIRTGQTGPTKRPYDLAGWTLTFQMGVAVDRIDDPFAAKLQPVSELPLAVPGLDARQNSAYLAAAALLAQGASVRRAADGRFLRESDPGYAEAKWQLQRPRVGLYEPWTPNADAGWTEWLLDTYQIPFAKLRNQAVRQGGLRASYDVILLPQQSTASLLHGFRAGESASGRADFTSAGQQRPEYSGGIGLEGAAALEEFVRAGGVLIAFDSASEMPLQLYPIGVRGLLREGGDYFCPGSILRITLDNTNPIAWGMPKEGFAVSTGGQAFEISLLPENNRGDRETKAVAWYAKDKLLASGWVSGEKAVLGRPALVDARLGQGRVVLFGFRPQFRGQSYGTFKLVLNAIYLGGLNRL